MDREKRSKLSNGLKVSKCPSESSKLGHARLDLQRFNRVQVSNGGLCFWRIVRGGLCCVLLIGCATVPSEKAFSSADLGPPPEDVPAIIKKWIEDTFIDPDSARTHSISTPVKGAIAKPLIQGGGYVFAWRVFVDVNARNRMGGFTGRQIHAVYIRDGRVISSVRAPGGSLPFMFY